MDRSKLITVDTTVRELKRFLRHLGNDDRIHIDEFGDLNVHRDGEWVGAFPVKTVVFRENLTDEMLVLYDPES